MKRPPWGHLPWRRSSRLDPVDHSWDVEDAGPLDITPDDLTRMVRDYNDYAPADSDPGRLFGHY